MKLRAFMTLVKLSLSYNGVRKRDNGRRQGSRLLIALVLLVFCFGSLLVTTYTMFDKLYDGLAHFHLQTLVVALAILVMQCSSLLFGIITAISTVYLSTDLRSFLPLPLQPWLIVAARFCALWLSQLVLNLFVVGAAFAVYGVHRASIETWIGLVALFLLVPVIPLVLAFVISALLMRVTNVPRIRDKFRFVSGFLGILIVIAIQIAVRQNWTDKFENPSKIITLLTGPNGMLHAVGRYFPPVIWETNSVTLPWLHGGLVNWVWVLLSVALACAVGILVAQYLFFSGYIGGSEVSRRTKRQAVPVVGDPVRSLQCALLVKEFRLFFRSPVFSLNALSGTFVPLVVALFSTFQHKSHTGLAVEHGHAHIGGNLVGICAVAIAVVIGCFNNVAASAISREGMQFSYIKSLPITPIQLATSKWGFANVVSLVSVIIVCVLEFVMFHPTWYYLLFTFALGGLGCLAANGGALLLDFVYPNLKWTNERNVIKGFKNGVSNLGILIVMGILLGLMLLLRYKAHASWLVVDVLFAAILGMYSFMRKYVERLVAAIE